MTTSEVARVAFEQALRLDEPGALYEQAPCGYLTTDADGSVLKANQTFCTWTGYPADALVGATSFSDLLTPGSRMFHETHLRPLLHLCGRANEIALDLVRADGTELPVLVNVVMDQDEAGVPTVTRMAVFDATERRRYERQLLEEKRRAEESERRFAAVARTLQETLMPPRSPRIEGIDVATGYRPAGAGDEIGGDFYDVFEVADGDWVVTIGDVAGKGVEAAVVATLARHTVRAVAITEPSPAGVLGQLNRVVLGHPSGRFITAAVLRMRRTGDRWDVAMSLGGHPLPVVLERRAAPRTLGEPGHLVGAFDFVTFVDTRFELRRGTTLLLHTDGVTEAADALRRGELYGEERLMRVLHEASGGPDEIVDRVLADVLEFQHGTARDDIALVALQVPPRQQ